MTGGRGDWWSMRGGERGERVREAILDESTKRG